MNQIDEETLNAISLFSSMRAKAKADVLIGKFRQLFNLQFQLGLLGDDPYGRPYADMCSTIEELKAKLKSQKANKSEYLFITVNLSEEWFKSTESIIKPLIEEKHEAEADASRNEVCFYDMTHEIQQCVHDEIYKKLHKFQRSKMFLSSIAVIEQRESEWKCSPVLGTKLYRGQHIHMLVQRSPTVYPSKIDFETRKVWRSFVGNPDNKSLINVKQCPVAYVPDKLEYILGLKTGQDASGNLKSEKQSIDTIFRQYFNLSSYYYEKKIPSNPIMEDAIEEFKARGQAEIHDLYNKIIS